MRLDAFRGIWRVSRTVADLRLSRTGRFTGEARFTPHPHGLAYLEEGTLVFPDAPPMAASRRYVWCEAGGDAIELRFADGRFFHRFQTDDERPSAQHDCPPDRYRVRYDFGRWPRWRSEWRVTGPGKDQAIVTDYRRAGQGGETGA